MLGTIVYDLLIILSAGLVAGLVCRWLRVSVLVGYLLVGALVGKGCFGWVSDESHEIEYIAEAGVFLLLFSIGLEFSLNELWRLGRNLVIGGSVQMLLVAVPVAALLLGIGMDWQPTIVIAESDYQRIVALAIGSLILTPLLLKTGLRWTRLAKVTDEASTAASRLDRAEQEALVIGAGPIGRQVASRLKIAGKDVCVIDLSPVNLHGFAQEGLRTVAGDATDRATLKLAQAEAASLAVVCVPDDEAAFGIVRTLCTMNTNCFVLVRCRYEGNVAKLTKSGANRVISEEAQAGAALFGMLADFF